MSRSDGKLALVLDLDETLIHATPSPPSLPPIGTAAGFDILARPHLAEFLRFAGEHFDLVAWSASEPAYVEDVIDLLGSQYDATFTHVLTRDHCVPRITAQPGEPSFRKELRTVRRPRLNPRRTLCIDNYALSFERDLDNVIEVRAFQGEPDDHELVLLKRFLQEVVLEVPFGRDVRQLELRTWRNQVSTSDAP